MGHATLDSSHTSKEKGQTFKIALESDMRVGLQAGKAEVMIYVCYRPLGR